MVQRSEARGWASGAKARITTGSGRHGLRPCPTQLLPGQLAQVFVAGLDAVERLLGMVMLDDVVLDPGLFGLGEDPLPVDDAAAYLGEIDGVAKVLRSAL